MLEKTGSNFICICIVRYFFSTYIIFHRIFDVLKRTATMTGYLLSVIIVQTPLQDAEKIRYVTAITRYEWVTEWAGLSANRSR